MGTSRRRRWVDVLRRTARDEDDERAPRTIDEAALFAAHDGATRSCSEAAERAERLAAAVARQRGLIEGAAERANQIAARAEALAPAAARVIEAFERLGVIALNAGLEGARAADPQARGLLLVSEEIRANVRRGADAAEQLGQASATIAAESGEVRRQLERSRGEVSEVAQEAAQLQAAAQLGARSLASLGGLLRDATGVDPELARAATAAGEHAKGLLGALSTLATSTHAGPLLGALRPVIAQLARVLDEIEERAGGADPKPRA